MSVVMDSSAKEVTIDDVRCEEVHFHAETNGDEKNILMSFNELVTNFSSDSKQFLSTTGENIEAIISTHNHARTNYDPASRVSLHFTQSEEQGTSDMSSDHVKSNKSNGISKATLGNTSAQLHSPYRFVRSKESDKAKHKDSWKEQSSSNLKMNISLAPHLKLSHQYTKTRELKTAMIINEQKQSTKSFKNVRASSSNEDGLKENAREAVLKMTLDSSKPRQKAKVNDDGVEHQYEMNAFSQPAKKCIDINTSDDSNNDNISQRKPIVKKDIVGESNVKFESSSESNENSKNISTHQSSSCYESFRFEPLPSFCDKSFGQNLTTSMELQDGGKGYKCKFCNKSFAKERYLKMHQKVHSEDRPYRCNICNKTFRWRSNLTEHRHIHYDKPFQCGVCKQEFSQLSDFRNHQLIHSEERPVKCQCCDKSFDDPRLLKVHYQIHSEDRPYKCTVCDKAFRWRSNLTGHMHIHNIDKPYKCEICMQGFTQISNFKNHQVLHSGEKPHKCPECNKTFAQSRYLKTHLKLHSEERPYKCKHCGKTFRWPGNLRGHLQLHKQDKAYKCDHCGSSFSQYASLSRHLNHHCTVNKRYDVPSQTFRDRLEISMQKRQKSKDQEADKEMGRGEEEVLLKHLSKENCNEIHVVFKQHDELQPMISEEEIEVNDEEEIES